MHNKPFPSFRVGKSTVLITSPITATVAIEVPWPEEHELTQEDAYFVQKQAEWVCRYCVGQGLFPGPMGVLVVQQFQPTF